MADMQRAIRLLRANKADFRIGDKIVVLGFSAGGMICGNCATHYDNGMLLPEDMIEHYSSGTDACVVCCVEQCLRSLFRSLL